MIIMLFILVCLSVFLLVKNYGYIKKIKNYNLNISMIAHEIKNSLTIVKGYSNFINNKSKSTLKWKTIIDSELDILINLINEFKSMNDIEVVKSEIDFKELLDEIKDKATAFTYSKNISLTINTDGDLHINGDYDKLRQVLINIIKNSSESVNNNGNIKINSYKRNNNLILTIKDDGCGMDKNTLNNLFVPYYSSKNNGYGLGLCISKEIIEKHNGFIKYSSLLNHYTKIKIVIPVY